MCLSIVQSMSAEVAVPESSQFVISPERPSQARALFALMLLRAPPAVVMEVAAAAAAAAAKSSRRKAQKTGRLLEGRPPRENRPGKKKGMRATLPAEGLSWAAQVEPAMGRGRTVGTGE